MSAPGWRLLVAALIALAGSMLPAAGVAQTVVKYVHTDALGSVVAMTDQSRNVLERREYEPYGEQLTPAVQGGPGYTGHVQDAATGLVYMQQRYYDPQLGIFLSVDPVTAYTNPIVSFNRYRYANGNPYSFLDPNGMDAIYVSDRLKVVIPVYFEGNMASAEMKAAVISKVASLQSGYMGLNSFQAVEADAPGVGVNRLVLGDSFHPSFGNAGEGTWGGAGGSYIHINCVVGDCAGKAAHDLLHAAGVSVEGYIDSGRFENRKFEGFRNGYGPEHIMAHPGGNQVKSNEASQVLGNNTTRTMSSQQFQGVFRVDGRISSKRLAEDLKGK